MMKKPVCGTSGNRDKAIDPSLPGSLMTYNEKTGNVEGIGVMRLGFETDIVETRSYGKVVKMYDKNTR